MKLTLHRLTNRKLSRKHSHVTAERIISSITVLISLATILISVRQYAITQSMMDMRKYNHAYYDERYNVLKSLAHSLSEIPVVLVNGDDFPSKETKETMLKAFTNFNYTLLVLDERNKSDKRITTHVKEYQKLLNNLWSVNPDFPGRTLHPDTLARANRLGKKIIELCGQTLKHEKDSINSYHPGMWSFSSEGK